MSTIDLFMIIKHSDFQAYTSLIPGNSIYYLTYYFVNFLTWYLIYMILYVIARLLGNLRKRVY